MFRNLRKFHQCDVVYMLKRNKGLTVDSKVLQKLDKGYDKLLNSDSKSLLKKHLTPDIFQKLRTKQTGTSTLLDCIQSGLIHHDSVCGIYAACSESYKVFAELFDPIIGDLHLGYKKTDKQPPVVFGDPDTFEDIDPNRNYIASVRMQCVRSLRGYPFNPRMTPDHYNEIEDKVHCISTGFQDEFEGEYRSLFRLDKALRMALVHEDRAFRVDDRFLTAAKACRHWPTGRGLFRNSDGTFLIWCNGEEHLCVTAMQRDGNFGEAYARLIRGVRYTEKYLSFARDERLGFLTFCPMNLGTALRASVSIRIPKLAAKKDVLEDVAKLYNLMIQRTPDRDEFYDISTRRQLCLTEFEVVTDLYCGVREIIQLEKELPVVKRKPEPPPPHIDPQKAIKSGLIDDRKKRRSSNLSLRKPSAIGRMDKMKATKKSSKNEANPKQVGVKPEVVQGLETKHGSQSLTIKAPMSKDISSAQKSQAKKDTAAMAAKTSNKTVGNQPAGAKPSPTQPSAIKSQSMTTETKSNSINEMPAKCLNKKKAKSLPKKTQKSLKSEKKSKMKCKTKASQSTDPCTRAGIKMPATSGEMKAKLESSKQVLGKEKEIQRIRKNVNPSSTKTSSCKNKNSTGTDSGK